MTGTYIITSVLITSVLIRALEQEWYKWSERYKKKRHSYRDGAFFI